MTPRLFAHCRRVVAGGFDDYEWLIGTESTPAPDNHLVLTQANRARWPAIVRDLGITRLDAITFVDYQERARFALDCDLLDGYTT